MRIVFMGSAAFACPALEALLRREADPVAGIVTQPDRPKGRCLELAACPVKSRAAALGIPILTPVRVNAPESVAQLRALGPDVMVVVAYGQILRPDVLAIPPRGCVNVHGSLLPRYRGAAPIHWALARGERVTGVTAMMVNERMDAGDILMRRELAIEGADSEVTLHDRLAGAGAALLMEALDALRDGTLARTRQEEDEVSYAPKVKKADGRMDWGMRACRLACRVRAFTPWPGCVAEAPRGSGRFLKVLQVRAEPGGGGRAGSVIAIDGEGPLVQTGDGALRLLAVQPEGRRAMSGSAYVRGHALQPGARLG